MAQRDGTWYISPAGVTKYGTKEGAVLRQSKKPEQRMRAEKLWSREPYRGARYVHPYRRDKVESFH